MSHFERLPTLRIRCAVCDKPVEAWEVEHEPYRDVRRIRVNCHGDTDIMEISSNEMEKLTREEIDAINTGRIEGVAFTTKKLASTH